MAEIKSTLDIVMEKTKHLSLSKEEKDAQKVEEIRKTVKGMIQKFKDQVLRKDPFHKQLETLENTYNLKIRHILKTEILDEIDLGLDNTSMVVLLSEICGENVSRIESILKDYDLKVAASSDKRAEKIKASLSDTYFISGTAVVPNLENDNNWVEDLQGTKEAFQKDLDMEKAVLKNG